MRSWPELHVSYRRCCCHFLWHFSLWDSLWGERLWRIEAWEKQQISIGWPWETPAALLQALLSPWWRAQLHTWGSSTHPLLPNPRAVLSIHLLHFLLAPSKLLSFDILISLGQTLKKKVRLKQMVVSKPVPTEHNWELAYKNPKLGTIQILLI